MPHACGVLGDDVEGDDVEAHVLELEVSRKVHEGEHLVALPLAVVHGKLGHELGLVAEVEARLDQMEEDTQTYLARPEVVALTREQYDAITPKQNSLYVIVRGGE